MRVELQASIFRAYAMKKEKKTARRPLSFFLSKDIFVVKRYLFDSLKCTFRVVFSILSW